MGDTQDLQPTGVNLGFDTNQLVDEDQDKDMEHMTEGVPPANLKMFPPQDQTQIVGGETPLRNHRFNCKIEQTISTCSNIIMKLNYPYSYFIQIDQTNMYNYVQLIQTTITVM